MQFIKHVVAVCVADILDPVIYATNSTNFCIVCCKFDPDAYSIHNTCCCYLCCRYIWFSYLCNQ